MLLELPEFLTAKTLYLIAHIFGAILGAGGAFASDAMFFKTIKDGVIENVEVGFMKLGGKLVWSGVGILVISGVLLFFTNPEQYLASSKFLAKVTIVLIIIANGLVFHTVHMPHIKKHIGIQFNQSPTFIKKSAFLMASGAVSMVSWVSTVVLGMLKEVPYDYIEIFGFYLVLVALGVSGALLARKKILKI